ncbi:hypothetical protein D3C78_1553370 [compost metagenome]
MRWADQFLDLRLGHAARDLAEVFQVSVAAVRAGGLAGFREYRFLGDALGIDVTDGAGAAGGKGRQGGRRYGEAEGIAGCLEHVEYLEFLSWVKARPMPGPGLG